MGQWPKLSRETNFSGANVDRECSADHASRTGELARFIHTRYIKVMTMYRDTYIPPLVLVVRRTRVRQVAQLSI